MTVNADTLGRIAKIFIDRDDATLEDAAAKLSGFRIILRCGPEVGRSATFQAAVLTAANIACRCFPGGVRLQGVEDFPLSVRWSLGKTFRQALIEVVGEEPLTGAFDGSWHKAATVGFGSVDDSQKGLQASFDGWTCAVSPCQEGMQLPGRERCVLTGVALGGLAISEVFLGNFGFVLEAGARTVGLSLWRPDLPWDAADAGGIEASVRFLPNELWFVGLGHLGQAFGWAFSFLPFSQSSQANIVLQDYDHVVRANLDTGLLSYDRHVNSFKTRVVNSFFEDRGLQPRLIERKLDEYTHPQHDDPRVLLTGMDAKGPRYLLDQLGFDMCIDCGVGGSVANFDSITMHVVPKARMSAAEIWPKNDAQTAARHEEDVRRLATSRTVYKSVLEQQGCGHVELAGRAVAVPFVGAMASALALSELLRRLARARTFDRIHLQLALPCDISTTCNTDNSMLRMPYQDSTELPTSAQVGNL